jgi:hypothetical protein
MLVTVCPRPTGPARQQLFENCQVYMSTPPKRLEAEKPQILAWRSIPLIGGLRPQALKMSPMHLPKKEGLQTILSESLKRKKNIQQKCQKKGNNHEK